MENINLKRKQGQPVLRVDLENSGCLPVLRYQKLEGTGIVRHGFSTRLGGVSEGIFSTLNLSFTRGDEQEAVLENYKRFANAVGVDYKKIVTSDQTHTTNVRRVYEADAGEGVIRQRTVTDVDGMVTNEPGLALMTFYADCVPLYFVDPVNKAIGLSHSGWRGTVNRMGKVTIEKMREEFGTEPEDLICAIGPSICRECYEVSKDVIEEFQKEFEGHEQELFYKKENGKYQLDLWKANEIVMLEAGVKRENLSVTDICTCCNSRYLFSHRASHGKRGNLAACLALK